MLNPVFISGCSRSGTTMLGDMLGVHRSCLVTPESQFFLQAYQKSLQSGENQNFDRIIRLIKNNYRFKNWGISDDVFDRCPESVKSIGELIEAVVRTYAEKNGKSHFTHWIDHTPMTIKYVSTLQEIFPQAKFIHLVRDGRAVAASLLDVDWGGGTMNEFASLWMNKVGYGLAAETYLGDKIIRVKFEDIVCEPTTTLTHICNFIGVEYSDEMIAGKGLKLPKYTKQHHALIGCRPQPDRATAWQKKLTSRQVEIFERKCCDYLKCLGYEPLFGIRAKPLEFSERVKELIASRGSRIFAVIKRRKRIRLIDQ